MGMKIFVFFVVIGLFTILFSRADATSVSGVSTHATTSQNMEGMLVTVTFGDTSISPWTGYWDNIVSTNNSGVSDTAWSFINSPYSSTYNDTYWNPWTLNTSVGITSITMNGIIADVMFDVWGLSTGDKGTTDSEWGAVTLPAGWTYTTNDAISIGTSGAVGDLWGSITLTYNALAEGFTGTANFRLDSDKTLDSEVPEPATMTLFGLGILGFGVRFRKSFLKG